MDTTGTVNSPKRGTAAERVLAAATRLLIENHGHLEMNVLAVAANCSTGAIYHNFGSKTGVLVAVVNRYNSSLAPILLPPTIASSRDQWLESARIAICATVEFMWNEPMTPVIVREAIQDAGAAAEADRWLGQHTEVLSKFLLEAQGAGHLPNACDPAVLAAGIAGGMRQIMRMYVSRPAMPALADVKREMWNFVARQLDLRDPADYPTVSP